MLLDHIANINADEADRGLQGNVVSRLADLSGGLNWIAFTVSQIEQSVFARLETEREMFSRQNRFVMMGGKQLSHVDQGMVMCAFHWYAVSVCNYARTVGWVRFGPDKKKIDDYVTSVLPSVALWRNKVAAHFGFTDPRGDNLADFTVYSMPLCFTNEGFSMGEMKVSIKVQDVAHSSSDALVPWSLTDVHRQLRPRYWPTGPFQRSGGMHPTTTGEFLAMSDLGRPVLTPEPPSP
jgi:hypothetical protein